MEELERDAVPRDMSLTCDCPLMDSRITYNVLRNIKLMTLLIRRNWAINYSVRKRAAKTERNEVPKVQPTYWFANSLASFARIKLLGM